MPLLFLRHAQAGNRLKWEAPDRLRPLSEEGRLQAEALIALYAPLPVTRVLSSPYVRCVQTVEPLAVALGLDVEERSELAEGTGARPTLELMRRLAGTTAERLDRPESRVPPRRGRGHWRGRGVVLDRHRPRRHEDLRRRLRR